MNSILNNSAALSALQALTMTQQALNTTQNQVSSGLAVANASDNASYWSISQQLQANSGIANAANTALAQSQAIFSTANSAIQSIITTINSIQTALTSATNPGPSSNFTTINTTLASLSSQLTDAVSGASFNGTNLLDGSNSSTSPLQFVSGYNSSTGAVTNIGFTTSALTGGAAANTTTTTQFTVTDASTVAGLNSIVNAGSNGVTTASYQNNSIVVTAGTAGSGTFGTSTWTPGTADNIVITSVDQAGNTTVTTYNAIDANGQADSAANELSLGGTPQIDAITGYTATQTVTPVSTTPATTGLLSQQGTSSVYDLTKLGTGTGLTAVTAANAGDMLAAATAALKAVTNYATQIGATQDRMTAASTFNSALTTDYANGVAALVDADMNTASTRLQALQTQQQLGIQSLSIANQNAQLILKLFPG